MELVRNTRQLSLCDFTRVEIERDCESIYFWPLLLTDALDDGDTPPPPLNYNVKLRCFLTVRFHN